MVRFVAFTWFGLVLGVSFLATPVKFRASSLTLPVALDVGRATFHAFGKVEMVLTVILAVLLVRSGSEMRVIDWGLLVFIVGVVATQVIWLIPQLDVRVAAIIAGEDVVKSHMHTVYAVIELMKALALLGLGVSIGGRT